MCTNSTPSRSPKIVLGRLKNGDFFSFSAPFSGTFGQVEAALRRTSFKLLDAFKEANPQFKEQIVQICVEKIASWNTKRLAHKQKIQGTSKPKPEEPKVVQEEEWQAGTTHKKRIAHGSAKPLEISEAVTNLLKATASKTLCGGKQRGYMMKALKNKFRGTAKKKSGGPVHVTF